MPAKYLVRTELASYSIFVGNKCNRNIAASCLVHEFVSNVHTAVIHTLTKNLK